jgi:N-acylglucosamine 2-epimerase/mannose-6-phosphate isomerase
MFDAALPFWTKHAVDVNNLGFVEQLTLNGADAKAAFKRTRVACRQIYVFSHARLLGWSQGGDLPSVGMRYLTDHAWQGSDKGFAKVLSQDGHVLDPTPDLYDHAFVLFAFAWGHRALKDAQSLEWMHRTLDFVEQKMLHPSGHAYWHELPPRGWRLQNPHMHMTEACLAAFEATGDRRFADASARLIELFRTRLFDRTTGMLPECFTDDWHSAPGEEGRVVEPGHMMEWAWILNQARKHIGADVAEEIRSLVRQAERFGVDSASGVTYNAIRNDGAPLDRGSRTWPNTERIKAAVALYELDGVDPAPVIENVSELLLSRYLANAQPGLWMDAFDEHGKAESGVVPASTLYHVFLAFAEILRIAD